MSINITSIDELDDPVDTADQVLKKMEEMIMNEIKLLIPRVHSVINECQNRFHVNYNRIRRERSRESEKKFLVLQRSFDQKLKNAKYIHSDDVASYIASLRREKEDIFKSISEDESEEVENHIRGETNDDQKTEDKEEKDSVEFILEAAEETFHKIRMDKDQKRLEEEQMIEVLNDEDQ